MAGGTGGHVYPALAVARALQQQSRTIVWLGTHRGIESTIVPAANINIEWISIQGLRGKGVLTLLLAPVRLLWALLQSTSVMIRHRPAVVLGMGGFVSGPGGLAAWLTRRPLVIHEQNAVAGLTNRLLARLARVVLQAFPGSFPAGIRSETVGNPVRQEIAAIDDPTTRFAGRVGAIRLLVLGGSQGALALNRTVPQALALLSTAARPIVRHQAGTLTLQTAIDAYEAAGLEADVTPFIENMAEAYAWADIVVCRAGALTVAEVATAGLAAVFVPFPAAVDDHQTENARPMVEAGAAIIMQERDLTPESLAERLGDLLSSRDVLQDRAIISRGLAQPNALGRITDICLQAAGALT
jgi:UDP-N-acetylglucosamine--N-acetylmuramyl-(pentapeptide) pyrophosphoryl-undecaprenol N-acetylglucosamine transferase